MLWILGSFVGGVQGVAWFGSLRCIYSLGYMFFRFVISSYLSDCHYEKEEGSASWAVKWHPLMIDESL